MNFKEKKIAYVRLLSPTQAKHDIELLKKVFKDESKIITFARDPIRYAGDILYALLEHKTPEQIVQNRRKKQADADKVAADKVVADQAATDKAAADKVAADQAAADKAAADKIAADQAAADKAASDKIAADKAAADKVADQTAADKVVDQTVDETIAQEHSTEEPTEQTVTEAAVSVKDEEKKSE